MADELDIVDQWLFATLGNWADLTALLINGADSVHNTEAPTGAVGDFPAVIFQHQGSVDVRGNGPDRIGITGLWIVKGVMQTRDFGAVTPIATEIDHAIEAGAGTAADGFVFACVREAPFSLAERSEDGHDFRHRGGQYRIFAQRP